MQTLSNSLSAVVVVMLLMSVGYFMGRAGWLKAEHKPMLTKLLINIAIPAMIINYFQTNFADGSFMNAGRLILVPVLSIGLVMLAAMLTAKALKLPASRSGLFVMMACLSNSIFIGFPMCLELFGDASTPYVMWYYLINTTFFQTVGVGLISRDVRGGRLFSSEGLLCVAKNPPTIALAAGTLLLLLNIPLPRALMSFTKYLGNTVSPLGLVYTGFIMYETGFKDLRPEKGLPSVMLFRFIVSPLVCMLFCSLLGVSGLARSVNIIEMSMPTMTQTVVLSALLGADEKYAAKAAALSALLAFIAIPLLMLIV